jgi:hypothetical protein
MRWTATAWSDVFTARSSRAVLRGFRPRRFGRIDSEHHENRRIVLDLAPIDPRRGGEAMLPVE